MGKGIIYIATSPSGKCYVGKTMGKLPKRIRAHIKDSKRHNFTFSCALRKYGHRNFSWSVLYDEVDEKLIDVAEICAIYVFETYYFGYNSTLGGDGTHGFKLSSEQIEKISKRMKENNPAKLKSVKRKISEANRGKKAYNIGVPLSDETKRKISETKRGRPKEEQPFFGKKHTNESKKKMSKSHADIHIGDKNGFFGKKHSEEAKKRMSQNRPDVSGKNNPFFGKKHTESTLAKMSKKRIMNKKRTVLSINEMKEIRVKYGTKKYSYNTLAVEYGVSKTAIRNVIKRKTQKSKHSLENV